MAYDDVIIQLGEFGRYQKRIYILLCLPAILCAFHKFSGVFLQAKVKHRCLMPTENIENVSYYLNDDLMNMVYPRTANNKTWSSCSIYNVNFTDDYFEKGKHAADVIQCNKWVYDKSLYETTTVMEWNTVCHNAWLRATSDSLLMIGVMLGSIIFGDLSDRLGRRLIFFVSLVMQVIFGILVAIAPEVYSYMLARLIVGSTTSGVFLVAYVIALEMVGPKMRMFCGVACQLFFTVGFVLTAVFAYFIPNWRILQIALTVPGIVFFCYWRFIPESVRWLLTKGRHEEAKEILRKAAKENNNAISEEMLSDLCRETDINMKAEEELTGRKPSLIDLFKYPNLRKKSLIIFFLWFVNSGAYYGLSWNTSNLGGNEYINFAIAGAVEAPAYIFLMLTLNRWGRKIILCGCMIAAGFCLMATLFVYDETTWLKITLAMSGKMAITASYGTVYIFSAEQFPTVIRNVGIGAASTFARVGGILAPYINIMAEIWSPLPLILFGASALLGGIMALFLPETLNKTLPESIADGELFGKKPKKLIDQNETQMEPLTKDKV